jgi:hypothetical protein
MPTFQNVFVSDVALSNLAAERVREMDLLNEIIAPSYTHEGNNPKGTIYTIDPFDDTIRIGNDLRGLGQEYPILTRDVNRVIDFNTVPEKGVQRPIPVETEGAADPAIEDVVTETYSIVDYLSVQKEARLVTQLATLTNVAVTQKWGAVGANPGPITQIETQCNALRLSGVTPNCLAMDVSVMRAIAQSPEYVARAGQLGAQGENRLKQEAVAQILSDILLLKGGPGVVITHQGIKNTAPKGATPVNVPIWGEGVFLGSVKMPSKSYAGTMLTIDWTPKALVRAISANSPQGGMVRGWRVETCYDDKRKVNIVRGGRYYDQIVANPTTGVWFTGTLT